MLAGKPMVQHVYERAIASAAGTVVVATDDDRVADAARAFGAEVALTSADHSSGTDRVAEVSRQYGWDDAQIIVNVQGDAPLVPSGSIDQCAALLRSYPSASVATLCVRLQDESQYLDPNTVKVVFDDEGRALYFSRAPIPSGSHGSDAAQVWSQAWRHVGLYAYRPSALERLTGTEPCELERLEQLEQLRALWLGMEIRIEPAVDQHGPDVDTPADLQRVEALLAADRGGS